MKYYILTVFLLSACGIEHHHAVDPVNVNIKHQVDLSTLDQYFKDLCERLHPEDADVAMECADDYMDDFLRVIHDLDGSEQDLEVH